MSNSASAADVREFIEGAQAALTASQETIRSIEESLAESRRVTEIEIPILKKAGYLR